MSTVLALNRQQVAALSAHLTAISTAIMPVSNPHVYATTNQTDGWALTGLPPTANLAVQQDVEMTDSKDQKKVDSATADEASDCAKCNPMGYSVFSMSGRDIPMYGWYSKRYADRLRIGFIRPERICLVKRHSMDTDKQHGMVTEEVITHSHPCDVHAPHSAHDDVVFVGLII